MPVSVRRRLCRGHGVHPRKVEDHQGEVATRRRRRPRSGGGATTEGLDDDEDDPTPAWRHARRTTQRYLGFPAGLSPAALYAQTGPAHRRRRVGTAGAGPGGGVGRLGRERPSRGYAEKSTARDDVATLRRDAAAPTGEAA